MNYVISEINVYSFVLAILSATWNIYILNLEFSLYFAFPRIEDVAHYYYRLLFSFLITNLCLIYLFSLFNEM